MQEEQRHWATSYAITAWQLFIGFPLKKYLTIYDDFEINLLRLLCGKIFTYFMKLVIDDIINNNIYLKFPPGVHAFVEMKCVSGEDFSIARLNGAFQDIDFLASDFTGYQLLLRFQNRYGKWTKRLYVSNVHKNLITNLTNQGKSLVSSKSQEVRHYVDRILKKFPILSKSEINKICTFGLKRFAYANRNHCDVLLCHRSDEILTAYTGVLKEDIVLHFRRWHTKWRMKERMLYHLKKILWDGYYYIGLTEEEHKQVVLCKGKLKHFGDVSLVKVEKELYHQRWCKHIWRIPYPIDCGWKFLRKNLITDKAEYIGENKYGKYHKCFCRGIDD